MHLRFCVATLVFLGLSSSAFGLERIVGTVTEELTGTPLSGIDIDVFDSTGLSVNLVGESTGPSGNYTANLPGPGTYTIRADASLVSGHADEFYNNVLLKSLATPITVNTGQTVSNINFTLPLGVPVAGIVTSSGAPLGNIDIDVFSSTGEFLSGYPGTTLSNGLYTVGSLPPGSYFIRADPDPGIGQFFLRTFFGGSTTLLGATPVVVGTTTVTGINIDVAPGGSIAGVVFDSSSGIPLSGIDLDLFDSLGARVNVNAKSGVTGAYEIGAVPAGAYTLRVDPTIAQGYPRMYYINSPTPSGATPITVTNGTRTTGINFGLGIAGTISGTIREFGTGTPLALIDLDCFDALGNRTDQTAKSDPAGAYQIGPMPPGQYFLRADPTLIQGYAEQVYNGQIDVNLGNPITVTAGADTPNIDFNLVLAGAITGTVVDSLAQPVANIDLDLFDSFTGVRLRQSALTAIDGTFMFDSLGPAQYKVRVDPSLAQGFSVVYFNGKLKKALADPITVTSGFTTPNIDFVLSLGASISGTVTNTDLNGPIRDMDIDVLEAVTFVRLDQSAKTDVNGNYTLVGLPPGQYVVRADPSLSQPFFRTYFGGAQTAPLATVITVSTGQNLTGTDIAMDRDPTKMPAAGLILLALTAALLAAFGTATVFRNQTAKAGR